MAADGLDAWGVDPAERDRLLGVIEQRCLRLRNGAEWQGDVGHSLDARYNLPRQEVLRDMLRQWMREART